MRTTLALSAALHALALAATLASWRWPRQEVPAQIEMVFGSGAQRTGAAANAPSVHAAASTPAEPAPAPSPTTASGQAVTAPVRLGDGAFGFDVPQPDPGVIEAQADPGNRPPPSPEAAFARGEHGRVVLRIHVRPDGRVGDVETLQSTGFADLDQDAVDAARRWHFIPQRRDGQAVASVRDQAFDFVLR